MEKYIKIKTNIFIKVIAMVLTIIMIFQFFPAIVSGVQQIQTEELLNEDIAKNNTKNTSSDDSNQIIGELIEKRTLNQKHFLQEDGSVVATIYPSDVHYEKDGKLLDINNSLEETKENEDFFQNKENSFQVKFSKKTDKDNLVALKVKKYNINWCLQNSNIVNATKLNNKEEIQEKFSLKNISSGIIQYENILNDIDLQYNVISNSIKENIILKDKKAIQQQIVFEFNTDNLKMEKKQEGKIVFSEKNSANVLFFLDELFMYDSKNEISNNIEIKLEEKNNKYILTILPSKEWLEDEKREYPVIIDPTVETSLNYNNIQDTYIFNGDSGYPNRYQAHILRVGSNNKIVDPVRSLLKFTLPNLNSGDQVIKATLHVSSFPDDNTWNPPTETIQIDAHQMTQDWNSSSASWNNLSTSFDSRIIDYIKYQYDTSNPTKEYYLDITSIVKKWYITGNNYGVVLKDHEEVYNAPHSDAYFYSSDVSSTYIDKRPVVKIIYRNQNGLENYQSYHTQSIGRAGTIYSNDYNGNLVLLHYDAATPGNLFPVKINHTYNTNNKDEDIGYGKGYRLNLSQTITNEVINGIEYAKYTDEDGTNHYFRKYGNEYKGEDNLGLTLTFENNNYYLKDKSNNRFTFIRKTKTTGYIWHLKEIEDSYSKTITIDLVDDVTVGAKITRVIDGPGNSLLLSYNSSNRLSRVTDSAGRTTDYTYNSNGNLTNIKYSDNKQSNYTYSTDNLLVQVKNIDNAHVDFEYYNEKANRLKSIKEYSTQNEAGTSLNIVYGDNVTKFTDNKGYSNTYTFNNYGQTISISDFGNNSNDIDNAYGKMYSYGQR